MGRNDSRNISRRRGRKFLQGHFFTPPGERTAFGKALGIRELLEQYSHVEHFDDDERTALTLAHMFSPEAVGVNLVHYGSTRLLYSRRKMETTPNIRRVNRLTLVV